jgi:hypothetical protein
MFLSLRRERWQWIILSTILSIVFPTSLMAVETATEPSKMSGPFAPTPSVPKKKKSRKQVKKPVVQESEVSLVEVPKSESQENQIGSSNDTSHSSNVAGDLTVYAGAYAFKGLEAGLMGAVKIAELPLQDSTSKIGLSIETGLHRARWMYQHSEYNRFSLTGDLRADFKILEVLALTPYIAAGLGYQREWYRGSDTALTDTPLSLRAGVFFPITEGLLLRAELAPISSSVRLGLALPF